MSVGISWIEYHPTVLGRAEASWLCNHIGSGTDGESSMVFIDTERAEEALVSAAECAGCEGFDDTNAGIKLHAETTELMRQWLPAILKEAKDKCGANGVDLSISW